MDIKEYFSFGEITKIYEKDNKIIFRILEEDFHYNEEIVFVFVEIDGGLVPFEFLNFDIRNNKSGTANLYDIDSIVLLKKLLNCKLFLPKTNKIQQKKTELTSHEIIGFTVIDKTEGIIGPIDDIIKYPNNPLYKIIYNEKEILVPANENIICTIDFDKKEVVVNIPTGLLEL
ncbi:MAG: hypothetical protein HN704_06395 [Bacteroidetes bacterium]|jgi:16S rRNA processing protein RimM|nr:hypothetical protein [Bacteroidota bacterium]MBT6686151.1 hypothetical protein [Bacteroidota bacterium]MBT7143862.1 hypothetical protein [Bacteroidota bacterium]MBT7491217.1 hypothetical protein [Bacteroidota bacterium]